MLLIIPIFLAILFIIGMNILFTMFIPCEAFIYVESQKCGAFNLLWA